MTLQKLYTLITFIILIITRSAHAMEQDPHDLHPLLCLPQEIQQQIVFPSYNAAEIDGWQLGILKEVAQTFFIFNILSKEFHDHFKLPWSDFKREQKNHILKEVIRCMEVGSVNYDKYCMVPLLLIYSGADVDIMPENHSTCLDAAMTEDDERAIAFLLNHNANPYQLYDNEMPICFYATTNDILNLFLQKVDKNELLSKSEHVAQILLRTWCPPAIMAFWLDYGVNPRVIDQHGYCILHKLVEYMRAYGGVTIEDILTKGELLLERIPDLINWKNDQGRTPIDLAEWERGCTIRVRFAWTDKIIKLLRKYGGKSSRELEAESKATV